MLPPTVQILLFSATFPDGVVKYAEKFAPNSNHIKLKVQELTVRGISQMFMDCPDESQKYSILCQLYGLMQIGSSIIFVKVSVAAPTTEHPLPSLLLTHHVDTRVRQ